jgi:hypothetical protein
MTGVARLDAEALEVTGTLKHPRLRLPKACGDLRPAWRWLLESASRREAFSLP